MTDNHFELTVRPSAELEHFSDFLSSSVDVGFEETETEFIVRSEDDLDTIVWGLEQLIKLFKKL